MLKPGSANAATFGMICSWPLLCYTVLNLRQQVFFKYVLLLRPSSVTRLPSIWLVEAPTSFTVARLKSFTLLACCDKFARHSCQPVFENSISVRRAFAFMLEVGYIIIIQQHINYLFGALRNFIAYRYLQHGHTAFTGAFSRNTGCIFLL